MQNNDSLLSACGLSELYTEKVLVMNNGAGISEENSRAIQYALEMNNAVGTIAGYYDEKLTIFFASSFFMKNLGYEVEEFMKCTDGSLRSMILDEDMCFFEGETFRNAAGEGMHRMLTKDGTPVYVRMFKTESVDGNGVPLWVLSVRLAWDAQNLSLVNDIIQSGGWYVDYGENNRIIGVKWSSKFRQMLGFTDAGDFPDELESWERLIHPSDKPRVMELLNAAAADRTNKTKYNIEYRLKNKNGEYHWFKETAEINRRTDGTPSRMVGIFVNIDKRKNVEEKNEKFSVLHRAYSRSNLCEFYVDLHENTFEALKLKGTLNERLAGISDWDDLIDYFVDHVCEDSKRSVRLMYNRGYIINELRKLGGDMSLECRAKYDGEDYWVRNLILPVDCDENGTPQHVIVILRDITDGKKSQEDLERLVKNNHDMDELLRGMVRLVKRFAVCDLENDHYELHNLDKNNLLKTSGRYEDLIAEVCSKFKALDDSVLLSKVLSVKNIIENITSENDVYNIEYCSVDETLFKNMALIPLEFRNGVLTRVLIIIQDVTQTKQMERDARRALQEAFLAANRANDAKTEFLSNMSHDIRTPMNAIIGMTAIAGAHIGDRERVRDCLSKITVSSKHLLALINEVLDMSQIERGGFTLAEEEFRLPELVDSIVAIIKPSAEQHGHDLSVRITDVRHEAVIGDSLRVRQALVNILTNAVKYTPDGGKISFDISEKPTNSKKTACYEAVITDNGYGMSEDFLKVIFEPFTRADTKRTSKIPGTGLGMAITKNIVSMMNGNISVSSKLGEGSKFTVTFYLRLQDEEIVSVDELADLPVLVVDDDKICCESTVEMLNEIGMSGEYVTSGREAVDIIVKRHEAANDFFAAIIDWKMPVMDGVETTREIRRRVGRNVPIIVFTAYDCAEVEREARAAGADAFVTKPLFRSRLTTLFKDIVGGGKDKERIEELDDIAGLDYSDKRILLVEDNDLNREIASEILGMTGAKVETAENGKAAVDMVDSAGEWYYDIVFMDIQMPVLNGYEATAAIRAVPSEYAKKLPIVAMTANAFAEDVAKAKSAGMNDHVSKPLDFSKLKEVMGKWL